MCPANQTDKDEFSLTRQVRTWTSAWVLFLTLILCQEGSRLCQHFPTHQRQASWGKMKPTISWMSLKVDFCSHFTASLGGGNPLGLIRESVFGWKDRHQTKEKEPLENVGISLDPGWVLHTWCPFVACQIEPNNVQNRIKYKYKYPKKAEEKCHLMVQGT